MSKPSGVNTDALISHLRSPNEDVRRRASAQLAKSTDPAAHAKVADLLADPWASVTAAAVDILCDLAAPSTADALQQFADEDDRFDLVWRAHHALDAIEGRIPPGRPKAADMMRAYSPEFVVDALTWRHPDDWSVPGSDLDGWIIAVLPSFHPELLLVITDREVAIWFGQHSLWESIEEHGRWYPSAYRMVLTEDVSIVEEFTALATAGFDGADDAFGADGLTLGGWRLETGDRHRLPRTWLSGGPLAELLTTMRTLGMEAARHELKFDPLQDLGTYLGVTSELAVTDFPVSAMSLSGRCDLVAFDQMTARVPQAPALVDLTRLRFLSPDLLPAFTAWLDAGNALVIGDAANPYLANLPRLHPTWAAALEELATADGPVAPIQVIGYWSAEPADGLPEPSSFVAEGRDHDAERELADLLDEGIPYMYFMGLSPCRICGKHNGSAELTDGRYSWPEGLSHYVRDHHVQLPSAITGDIRPRPSVKNGRWLIPSIVAVLERSTDQWVAAMSGGDDA